MNDTLEQFLQSRALLRVDGQGRDAQRDLQVSIAVLLMHMAQLEGFSTTEIAAVIRALGVQFSLRAEEAGEVAEIADFLLREKGHVGDYVKVINQRYEKGQKVTLMAMLWKVMLADGLVTRLEAAFAAELCRDLGLGEAEVNEARAMAERGEV